MLLYVVHRRRINFHRYEIFDNFLIFVLYFVLKQKKIIKSKIDVDEKRNNRAETSIQIRKEKRDSRIQRSRVSNAGGDMPDVNFESNRQTILKAREDLQSSDSAVVLKTTQSLRRLLSIEKDPPIQPVIDSGIVPLLVYLLGVDSDPLLQFEAAWALTNIASGTSDHTQAVVNSGAIPHFVRLLGSPSEDVREQCAWALGNVAGDSLECRDAVLSMNCLPALLNIFTGNSRLSTIRNATWTLSNLFRGKPSPDISLFLMALPVLSRLIHSPDVETITDACWALSYISDGPNDRIQAVLEQGVAPRLVELLSVGHTSVQTPALRTVGNIVTGNDSQTQLIINLNALPAMAALLDHERRNVRKEACWTLSNITAGTRDQIQAVINAGCIEKLIDVMRQGDFEVQKEAAWTIANATSGGSDPQIMFIANAGAIPQLCEMLTAPDVRIVQVVLEGLDNILRAAKSVTAQSGNNIFQHVSETFYACGGVDILEKLQQHENSNIYERALGIIETYFPDDEDDVETEIAPTGFQNQFQFGGANNQDGGFHF